MNRSLDGTEYGPLVDKLHLGFGWVDIDVDSSWIEPHVYKRDRVTSHHQETVVRLLDRKCQLAILDPPAVDE